MPPTLLSVGARRLRWSSFSPFHSRSPPSSCRVNLIGEAVSIFKLGKPPKGAPLYTLFDPHGPLGRRFKLVSNDDTCDEERKYLGNHGLKQVVRATSPGSECSTGARLARLGGLAVHSVARGPIETSEDVLRSRGPHERVRPSAGPPRTSLGTLPKTQQERERKYLSRCAVYCGGRRPSR